MTVPLTGREQLKAEDFVPGFTSADAIKNLLAGGVKNQTRLRIGGSMARGDVQVDIAAERVAARHLAILAMTGGGKTVAARRVLRELISIGYPILIFDPHGDYLGLWEKQSLFPKTDVKLFYPHIVMTDENRRIVDILISKMTEGLTEPQQELLNWLLTTIQPKAGQPVLDFIRTLIIVAERIRAKKDPGVGKGDGAEINIGASTANAVRRSLKLVEERLQKMEVSNDRLRKVLKGLQFEALPDPDGRPEAIVRPWQVSILYLGGYDHLTQSTIVSVVMESLFGHRAELADRIAPFLTVVEEAQNFVPSAREGTEETPSLSTLRKVITEGRKFGVGLILITQRPSRVDETILAQCNSFLVMRLVNPKDQTYVRSVMENLPESDARMLPGFGPGQGIISGQAVRFPLLVKIDYDQDLVGTRTADEDFIKRAREWKPDAGAPGRARAAEAAARLAMKPSRVKSK